MKAVKRLNQTVLPDKMSAMIDLSLKSIFQCAQDPIYRILPDGLHTYHDGLCYVDMVGAILAYHVKIKPRENITFANLPENCRRLIALDDLIDGEIKEAFSFGDFEITDEQLHLAKRAWKKALRPTLEHAEWITEWSNYSAYLKTIGL